MLLRMVDRLASARLKLDRAREHLKVLKGQVHTFVNGEPKPYALSDTGESEGELPHWQDCFFEVREDPPIAFGLMAGDFIGNVNAALDHLVYGLSTTKPKGTGFPVVIDPDAYVLTTSKKRVSDRERLLAGVLDPDRAIIDAYQPYENGMQADPLWRMREFANADKHRVTQPAWARVHAVRINAPHGCETRVARQRFSGPVHNGALLFRFQVRCGGLTPKVKVRAEADMTLGFGPELVDLIEFDRIVERAADIIACF